MDFTSATRRLGAAVWAAMLCFVDGREVRSLEEGWAFQRGEFAGAEQPGLDDSAWKRVVVPHDWSIEGPFDRKAATGGAGGWLPSGVSWYRKQLDLPASVAGRRAWVEFDGVMAHSRVWFNGTLLGERPNGYVSFRYDVSRLIKPGAANLLAVRTDTSAQPASRWYTGAGIYRRVRFVTAAADHIAPWGVFVSTPEVSADSASVRVATEVVLASPSVDLRLRSEVLAADGTVIGSCESAPALRSATGPETHEIRLQSPRLWSLESPAMHTLVSRLMRGDRVIDEVRTPFGIRSAVFDSKTGFALNGRHFKIQGVCLHHDGGAVGAAVPLGVWQRRLAILRGLGVNAVRTAHNPPDPGFLDLCDRMGFLVMDEFFDCWTKGKNPHDYHRHFREWSQRDLRDGILRDRNHPSVILYSVGNEIHDTPKPDLAKPILAALVKACHETDPTRPVTQALFRPNVSGDYHNGLADLLDVIGTNYRDQELLDAWRDKPGRKIIGTEQGHERSTWLACRDHPHHAGQFLWCGIDYLGESRSWPLTVFNGGLIDRAGFVQPRGYERQSWWSGEPMVKVFRRIGRTAETPPDPGYEALEWKRQQVLYADWNPKDRATDQNIEVYSNADEVELLLNGVTQGARRKRGDAAPFAWRVAFEEGRLEAVARKGGVVVARDVLNTAGRPAKLELVADTRTPGSGWDDVAHVVVRVVDAAGTVVPDADPVVRFDIDGPGRLVAVDSGSVVSIEPFQADRRRAFQGQCLAIVRATGKGAILIRARADGGLSGEVRLNPGS